MHGGAVMGIGAALLEEAGFTGDGLPLADRWKAYPMPRSTDVPEILLGHRVTPSPFTLLGAKGAGEAGTNGAAPALVNAVLDALAPLGIRTLDMPLTSEKIWRAINSAGA